MRVQDGPPPLPDLPEDRGPARPGDGQDGAAELAPEHRRLAEELGTWDATFRSYPGVGMPPIISHGVEVVRSLGERWLVKDLRGQVAGQPYLAHGQVGFDPETERAVGTWIVAGEDQLRQLEGTYDLGRRTRVMESTLRGPEGQPRRLREVSRVLDAEHRSYELFELRGGGEQLVVLQIDLVLRARETSEVAEEGQPGEVPGQDALDAE